MSGATVAINIPCHDQVSALFAYDLARMMGGVGASVGEGPIETVGINMLTNTYIHDARQQLAIHALDRGADYILWLDADMRFPRDTLFKLMRRDVPIVGINYSTRGTPPDFVAVKQVRWEPDQEGIRCQTLPESEGLEEVEAIGGGACLVKREVYEALPDPSTKPWYWYDWLPETKSLVGEDVYFCRLAREAGFPVYVDHDLSKECAHVGSFEFHLAHAQAEQEGRVPEIEVVKT